MAEEEAHGRWYHHAPLPVGAVERIKRVERSMAEQYEYTDLFRAVERPYTGRVPIWHEPGDSLKTWFMVSENRT